MFSIPNRCLNQLTATSNSIVLYFCVHPVCGSARLEHVRVMHVGCFFSLLFFVIGYCCDPLLPMERCGTQLGMAEERTGGVKRNG